MKKIISWIKSHFHRIPEDVDGDGNVTVVDLLKVQKYLLKRKESKKKNGKN